MLDAYQSTVIAGQDSHIANITVHWDDECLGLTGGWPESNDRDWQAYEELIEELTGYEPLIRFTIHEWESGNWGALDSLTELDLSDLTWQGFGDGADVDYSNPERVWIDGKWIDVSAYVGVFCDHCGKRIE